MQNKSVTICPSAVRGRRMPKVEDAIWIYPKKEDERTYESVIVDRWPRTVQIGGKIHRWKKMQYGRLSWAKMRDIHQYELYAQKARELLWYCPSLQQSLHCTLTLSHPPTNCQQVLLYECKHQTSPSWGGAAQISLNNQPPTIPSSAVTNTNIRLLIIIISYPQHADNTHRPDLKLY